VPYDRSLDTLAVLEQAGKEVELITYPWEKHEFAAQRNDFMAWVVNFLNNAL
jgi:dipeptidyl aminopeptidase/acylaminoacyl peptidase